MDDTRIRQPPTEVVLGTPLELRRDGHELVVEVCSETGRIVELKRFPRTGTK